MAELVVQRVILQRERRLEPLYYHVTCPAGDSSPSPQVLSRRSLLLDPGSTLSGQSYFNSFYETYWRQYTQLAGLELRLVVSGTGHVRLKRWSEESGEVVLAEERFEGSGQELRLEAPPPAAHPREAGLLYFTLSAGREAVTLHRGEWVALDVTPRDVRLAAGYCTFNRIPFVIGNVRSLLEDPEVAGYLARVLVVDQGTEKLLRHPTFPPLQGQAGGSLKVVEQDNFGGAGGFTRCILEASREAGATHVLLMDDDAVLETESVFRMATFLALARGTFVLGGPMLDLLRPFHIHELGGRVHADQITLGTPVSRHSVREPSDLRRLVEVIYPDYNAWWLAALPLDRVGEVGLPFPFFLRGDDVEYGCRLGRAGVPTVSLPGLGVWHEPVYVKKRGWQEYYNQRNMLITSALYFPPSRRRLLRIFLGRLFMRLLALDYYGAWMTCEAVEDYLAGPPRLAEHPGAAHRRIVAMRAELGASPYPRSTPLPAGTTGQQPRGPLKKLGRFIRYFLRHLFRRSPSPDRAPTAAIPDAEESWQRLGGLDVVAVDDRYAPDYLVLRRSRAHFLRLLGLGLRAAWRLARQHRKAQQRWQEQGCELTREKFWEEYLGVSPVVPSSAARGAGEAGPPRRAAG